MQAAEHKRQESQSPNSSHRLLFCRVFNPRKTEVHRDGAEENEKDEGVRSLGRSPRRSRCLWEIVSVSGPTGRAGGGRGDQVLFSLDRIYIDSFPRRADRQTT